MLGGFDPRQDQLFFARKRRQALGWALVAFALLLLWVATQKRADETVEVALEPEIQDFAVEEEKPEVEEEPPPPPPENTKVKVTNKPKPKPKIKPPDKKQTDVAPESNQEKTVEHPGGGQPGGTGEKAVEKPKPKPKAEEPKPKLAPEPKPKPAAEPIDPTKPIDRPERASMPKPDPGNAMPDYPEALRDAGITGEVVVKLHIHMDGSVKGVKILRKKSSATTDEEKSAAEKAFVSAVIRVIKTWKYEPAKLDGEPISIWFPVNFPFSLTSG